MLLELLKRLFQHTGGHVVGHRHADHRGYGDIYPVTALGNLFGALISIFGIGMFALPTGVLGAAFLEEIRHAKKVTTCPHCGKEITDDQLKERL